MPKTLYVVKSESAPTVELDTNACAAYVRFSKKAVARTVSDDDGPGPIVTIDLDKSGEVVGVELLGVKEFSITALLRIARVQAPNIAEPHYVRAGATMAHA